MVNNKLLRMKFTAKQIAQALNGNIEGNPDIEVSSLAKIEEGRPGSISFLANPAYTNYIYDTKADIVIVNEDFKPEKTIQPTLIRVKDAYLAFTSLLEMYENAKRKKTGISKHAAISPSAIIGKNVFIGDFVIIGDNTEIGDNVRIHGNSTIGSQCKIGANTILFAGVKIYDECKIGKECVIHAGVVIGSDGFGFAPQSDNNYKKIPQIGNVIIEDYVEIGANTTIDRATLGSTIIKKGVKLDNLIQVAHNVEIGENTVIAAQTGISGSTKIGKNCMIGGQVGFAGHVKIADGTKIQAQAGMTKNIKKAGEFFAGSPAYNYSKFQRSYALFKNFEKIEKRISELEKDKNSD